MAEKKEKNGTYKYRPDASPFVATHYPFYWIAMVNNRYTHNMESYVKKAGLTITSWRVAMLLREYGALSVSDISKHASTKMPTITRTIYKMRDKELVDIYQLDTDARVTMVKITEKGTELIGKIIPSTNRMFDRLYDGLTEGQLQLLNETLEKLYENLPPISN